MINYTERDKDFTRKVLKAIVLGVKSFSFDNMLFKLEGKVLKLVKIKGDIEEVIEIPSLVLEENEAVRQLVYTVEAFSGERIKRLKLICKNGLTDMSEMFTECVDLEYLDIT